MENQQQNFLFGLTQSDTQEQNKIELHQNDIENLQKVVFQSFKYCQAKRSKNRYIRTKKMQQMKSYQKKLLAIVKKKSQQAFTSLLDFSTHIISTQQKQHAKNVKIEEQTLQRLKQKISQIKKQQICEPQTQRSSTKNQILKQKLKRITIQCEEQLQKMENEQKYKKTDEDIQDLINQMQKPFKKLCNYFSLLKKQVKQLNSLMEATQKVEQNPSC